MSDLAAAPGRGTASGLFDGVFGRGPVRDIAGDRGWLAAMLEAEAALARVEADVGVIPAAHAESIAAACDPDRYDVADLGERAADAGNPVVPLVDAIRAAVGEPAAPSVHRGATSQDILDTAAMLVSRRALEAIAADLRGAADAAARLAAEHRDTAMSGRTLLQRAVPTTFGLKAAGWMVALDEAADALDRVRSERLAAQLGGAAGTLAALEGRGPEVLAAYARLLGLAEPILPWHTDRTRIAEVAASLGGAAGAVGKVALDVVLLAQTEVGEVREGDPARGGSSSMPHKRNPVAAISARACAMRAPGLVASLLAGMPQEHERAAGAWHAEWPALSGLLVSSGSAAAWLSDCLEHLEVDVARMRDNLEATGGIELSERIVGALAPALGVSEAREIVRQAVDAARRERRPLADVLRASTPVADALTGEELARLTDPTGYLGSAGEMVDRALRVHRSRAGRP